MGAVLLIAIVLLLVGMSAYMILDLTQEREPAPEVVLEMDAEGDGITYVLVHEEGDQLDGEKVTFRGAADPDNLAGATLSVGGEVELYPVEETIRIVYTGKHGTTYTLETFDVGSTVPDPDVSCDWVDDETNGSTSDAKVTGEVVNCDVETNKVVEVSGDGVVIGDTLSDNKTVDADDAKFYGDVTAEDVVNIQNGTVTGSVTSRTADVKLDNATVHGEVTAEKVVDLQGGSTVDGTITSTNGQVDVLDGSSVGGDVVSDSDQVKVFDSEVSGSVATNGSLTLDGATIEGEVYVNDSDFSCSSSTINGQSCSEYEPEDPGDY